MFNSQDDQTNAPSPPSSLAIFKLSKPDEAQKMEQKREGTPPPAAFIQVGPWAYPLVPGQTTILKNELGELKFFI